jgi:hypothetical protein
VNLGAEGQLYLGAQWPLRFVALSAGAQGNSQDSITLLASATVGGLADCSMDPYNSFWGPGSKHSIMLNEIIILFTSFLQLDL